MEIKKAKIMIMKIIMSKKKKRIMKIIKKPQITI